jgi:hypothetical protein
METARSLFALLTGLALAGPALAQTITFRNDLPFPVVVQTVTAVRGALRKDQPELLAPGEASTRMPQDGDKIITVYDGRSNRALYKNALKAGPLPVTYSITVDPRLPGKVLLAPLRATPGR